MATMVDSARASCTIISLGTGHSGQLSQSEALGMVYRESGEFRSPVTLAWSILGQWSGRILVRAFESIGLQGLITTYVKYK